MAKFLGIMILLMGCFAFADNCNDQPSGNWMCQDECQYGGGSWKSCKLPNGESGSFCEATYKKICTNLDTDEKKEVGDTFTQEFCLPSGTSCLCSDLRPMNAIFSRSPAINYSAIQN